MDKRVGCSIVLTDRTGVEHAFECPAQETAEVLADAIRRTGASVQIVVPDLRRAR